MDLDLIAMEQWALAVMGIPAKERKKRLRESAEQAIKDIEHNLQVMKLLRTEKVKISYGQAPLKE